MNEIQKSKIPMESFSGCIINLSGFSFGSENAKMLWFTTQLDFRYPFIPLFGPVNSAKNGCVFTRPSILAILGIIAFAQILSSIIQSIVVPVISQFTKVTSKNYAMHVDHLHVCCANGIKSLSLWRIQRTPIPLIKPIVIACVYQSVLVPSEKNNLVGWVQRLRNRMSPETTFWHVPPPMGFAAQPLF